MLLCNRMFHCILGRIFDTEMKPKYEEIILLSSSRAFLLFAVLLSFSSLHPLLLVVYPYEKQWGYLEKSYKMQKKSSVIRYCQLPHSIVRANLNKSEVYRSIKVPT